MYNQIKLHNLLQTLSSSDLVNTLHYKAEKLDICISLASYIQEQFEYTIKVKRIGLSGMIDNNIPYGTIFNSIEFQVYGVFSLDLITCTSIVVSKNGIQESYASRTDKAQIDYNFEKASEFIICIWDALNLHEASI